MTLAFENDLDWLKMNQCAKYLGQRSSNSKVKAKFHYASWFGTGSKLVQAEIWPII